MPRSLKSFVAVMALLLCWTVVDGLLQDRIGKWLATGSEPSFGERALLEGNLWVLRWLPILLAPAVLAPTGATAYWLLANWRQWSQVSGERAVVNLQIWLKVLAGVLVCGVALLIGANWYSGRKPTGIGGTMVAAFGWSYAAALYNALSAQKMLHASGASRWSGRAVAWAAFGMVNCAFVHPFGVGIPLWVARTSRQGAAPDNNEMKLARSA